MAASWPAAEFIIGNPPFLGGKLLRRGLGDAYVDTLFSVYRGRVPPEADLVAYWFEQARAAVAAGRTRRVGFVSTNSIRGGANRKVLERLAAAAPVFEAWADEPWVVDGAAVRVSLVCFGEAEGEPRWLDGTAVARINPDLSSRTADLTMARPLAENRGVAFQGITKGGPFEVSPEIARAWLTAPLNPNGRPNHDVLHPIVSGGDIVKRREPGWAIDFSGLDEGEAALFEAPFEYALRTVKPFREGNKRRLYREKWWLFAEPRPGFRDAIEGLSRYIATPKVARHRLFVWHDKAVLPDNLVIAVARDDDMTFGVLHSRFHEEWAIGTCAWTGVGNDSTYTPTTTFETFPFPDGLTPDISAAAYAEDPRAVRIAVAARDLDAKRRAWLNPPDLVVIEPEVVPGYPDRVLPKDEAAAAVLRTRTLTNLYNERPAWLDRLHRDLDRAVAAAYGWPEDITPEAALPRLLALNLARAAPPEGNG